MREASVVSASVLRMSPLRPSIAHPLTSDEVRDAIDADIASGADVDRAAIRSRGIHREDVRRDDVADVGEIAGLLAVAMDLQRLAALAAPP